MAITRKDRIDAFGRLLDYLNEHLPNQADKPLFIDRQAVGDACAIAPPLVGRALLVLERNAWIGQAHRSHYYGLSFLENVTAIQLEEMYQTYVTEADKRAKERSLAYPTLTPSPGEPAPAKVPDFFLQPGAIDLFNQTKFDGTTPACPSNIEVEAQKTAVYGYHIATGIAWFNSPEEAALEGQNQALIHNLSEVTLIQKVGIVEIQKPVIRFYGGSQVAAERVVN